MIETAAQGPLSTHPPGQPARDGEAHVLRPNVYRYKPARTYVPAPVQQQWLSAAAVGAPPVPLPPGKLARRRAEVVGPLLSMPFFFPVKVRIC